MARRESGPDPKQAALAHARWLDPHPEQGHHPAVLAARERPEEAHPSLSLLPSPGPAAAEPGPRPDAGQDRAPGGGLDARYEQLRHAALHARAEAFPLGLGVLTGKGVTAWRHALAGLTPAGGQAPAPSTAPPPCPPPRLPPP